MKFDKDILHLYEKLIRDPSLDPVFETLYLTAKGKFQELFDKVFTIDHYEDVSESYRKLKEVFIDRYAKLYALASYTSRKYMPLMQLPEFAIDSIFESLGFSFHKRLKYDDKKLVVQNITELIQTKGSKSLEYVLQILLRYTDIKLIDLDLVLDSDGNWNLINPKTGFRYRIHRMQDNHWLTDLDSLKKRVKSQSLPSQFRTPFFTLSASKINPDDVTTIILFINVLVRNELRDYLKTGAFKSQIFLDAFDIVISLTELWLFVITLYSTYIKLTVGDNYLADHPDSLVIFDEDTEIKTEVFDAVSRISNQQLRELTYDFFMKNYDRLEDVTYEEFDSYLASTWDDYYALEEGIRKSYIGSAFFYLKLSKHRMTHFYIDHLWKQLTRLPKNYIEKYVSCLEDPSKGLLYVFYDHFTKNWNDKSSEIVQKIVRNAEGQLSLINPKLIKFKNKIVEKYNDGEITADDIQKLIVYLLLKIAEYLFKQYVIKFPIDIYFGVALNFYTKDILERTIDELKPTYARPIFGTNVVKFEYDNPLLESIRYLLETLMTLPQNLYDTQKFSDSTKTTLKLVFADLLNNFTHVYKFFDPNFVTNILNQGKAIKVNCCNALDPYCLSTYKDLKDKWLCCDDERITPCNWCESSAFYNESVYEEAAYDMLPSQSTNVPFKEVIAENPKCIRNCMYDGVYDKSTYNKVLYDRSSGKPENCNQYYIHDGSLIQTMRYWTQENLPVHDVYNEAVFNYSLYDNDKLKENRIRIYGYVELSSLKYTDYVYDTFAQSIVYKYEDRPTYGIYNEAIYDFSLYDAFTQTTESLSVHGIYNEALYDFSLYDNNEPKNKPEVIHKDSENSEPKKNKPKVYIHKESENNEPENKPKVYIHNYFNSDRYYPFNTSYFDKYGILLNDDIENWLLDAIQNRTIYSVLDVVDDLKNHPILSYLMVHGEILNQIIKQRFQESLTYNDKVCISNQVVRFKSIFTYTEKQQISINGLLSDKIQTDNYLWIYGVGQGLYDDLASRYDIATVYW